MTVTEISHTVDEARVEAFVGQVLTDFAGAATTAMTVIGDRLGIYRAMTGTGPVTVDELASRTGLNRRLLTEWLASQVVSGYITYDATDREAAYELPAEHGLALSVVDSPAYIVGAAEVVAGQFTSLGHLEHALRTDGGIDYGVMPTHLFHGIERFFRTAYVHQLAQVWFPAVDGLIDTLERGARVADVGCGHGVATLLMARTWPRSAFVGFDVHEPSVSIARARAIEEGSPANASFRVADSAEIGPGPFDVVVYFDALHDLGDPPAALRRAYDALADGGVLVAVEPWSTDSLEASIGNPAVRIDFAVSTSLCTPCSLAQPGAYGLGTQGGPTKRIELLTAAGFRDARLAADSGTNLVFAARK
jgi:SAM-dependent methyltransferase